MLLASIFARIFFFNSQLLRIRFNAACVCVCTQNVTLYGSSLLGGSAPAGQPLEMEGASQPGQVTKNGLVLYGTDGKTVSACWDSVSDKKANDKYNCFGNLRATSGLLSLMKGYQFAKLS